MEQKFDAMNKELQDKLKQFEEKNGDMLEFVVKQSGSDLHTMKMKEEILKNLDIDAEFENVDLLDYLGYERIISCKTKK